MPAGEAGSPRNAAEVALPPCPRSPNCVSSLATDPAHRVAPLRFVGDPAGALRELERIVRALPGARVVRADTRSLKAELRSRLFGFVDDLELVADPAAGVVHVRSASCTGYWDLGVNRRRVEALREALAGSAPDAEADAER